MCFFPVVEKIGPPHRKSVENPLCVVLYHLEAEACPPCPPVLLEVIVLLLLAEEGVDELKFGLGVPVQLVYDLRPASEEKKGQCM